MSVVGSCLVKQEVHWAVQLTVLPPVEELQTDPQTRAKWIDYSAYDAKATWQLAQALKKQLKVSSALEMGYC